MANCLFGGRTVAVYPTPDTLANKVEEYFEHCGKYNPPTYSGLARYLGFRSRKDLLNYVNKENEAYEEIIADALLQVESFMEAALINSKNPAGLIFALKNNAGWEDVSKKQVSGDDKKPIMFAWEGTNSDVIDVAAENVEKEGVLPPPTPKFGGSIDTV